MSAWQHLRRLASGAHYLEVVRSGHWIWIYDNMNLHQGVRHEREGKYAYYDDCDKLRLIIKATILLYARLGTRCTSYIVYIT